MAKEPEVTAADTESAELARLASVARFGDPLTVAEIMGRCRDAVSAMLLRVARRETDKGVAKRLREIAGQLGEVRF